jgi:hypothetical protein
MIYRSMILWIYTGISNLFPYDYPDSFMQLLGHTRAYFHLPYRQTQGVVIAHASKEVPCIPDYSTISRRINRLEIKINEKLGNDIVIA